VQTSQNLPWVEKYRPKSLDMVVSHEEITKTLSRLIAENRLPHLLFYGPPGTGKTSTVLAAARGMYNDKQIRSQVLELNASDDRGIQVVRQKIIDFVTTRGLHATQQSKDGGEGAGEEKRGCTLKLVILDEADAMTKDAQNALRRVIERYTESTRFCIICNYLSKIIPALQSRCTRFRFAPLAQPQVIERLNHIIDAERLDVNLAGKEALYKLSGGDMRKAINIMQSTSMAHAQVDEEAVYKCVGRPQPALVKEILNILLSDSVESAYDKMNTIRSEHFFALADILDDLVALVVGMEMSPKAAAMLMERMARIETHLAAGCSEKIQTLGLISAFVNARDMLFGGDETEG